MRDRKEPKLSDLAESGAIEQVAENVYFVHYPHKIVSGKNAHQLWLYAKKVRYGNTGSTVLGYDGDRCRIYGTHEEFENATSYKQS